MKDGDKGNRTPPIDPLWSAAEVAAVLRVSSKMVYKLAAEDPAFPKPKRIGNRLLRWRGSDVQAYLAEGSG